jgi:hypothetical protein
MNAIVRARPSMDRRLYLGASIVFFALVFWTFARTFYLQPLFGTPPLSLLLHIHGVVMTGWVVLLVFQTGLIAAHRVRWHRRLGVLGAMWAALVVLFGSITTLLAAAREVRGHTDLCCGSGRHHEFGFAPDAIFCRFCRNCNPATPSHRLSQTPDALDHRLHVAGRARTTSGQLYDQPAHFGGHGRIHNHLRRNRHALAPSTASSLCVGRFPVRCRISPRALLHSNANVDCFWRVASRLKDLTPAIAGHGSWGQIEFLKSALSWCGRSAGCMLEAGFRAQSG